MKIWVVMAKVEELQARSIDKVLTQRKKQSNIQKDKTMWRQDILIILVALTAP
jgi:hypothetical protein